MIKTEFGIIERIDYNKDYSDYKPKEYDCIYIDDDMYINDWWNQLILMKTYYHNFKCPNFALARYGVTLIPPESLPIFQDIVLSDYRINIDINLVYLANKIKKAISENKYMIHFGI